MLKIIEFLIEKVHFIVCKTWSSEEEVERSLSRRLRGILIYCDWPANTIIVTILINILGLPCNAFHQYCDRGDNFLGSKSKIT